MDLPKSIGRYEILDWVGRGGMGVLYRAKDPVLERDVAIKVMAADFSDDEIGRSRFYREARAVARLQHRNIVTLFDFGEEHGSPYIVMEYLRGQTLAQRLRSGSPVTVDQALDVAAQLGTGLHFAHAHGVIHRDVKPANIWLLDDGGVKLLDFGIAKFGESTLTTAGDVVGSVSYMSPEQLSGASVDGRSDIFSAGIVLYELLAGRRPFQGDTPTAIMMRIINDEPPPLDPHALLPAGLSAIVARALAKTPEQRYQHGAELASDLQELRATFDRSASRVRAAALSETIAAPLPPPRTNASRPRGLMQTPAPPVPQSLIETGDEEAEPDPLASGRLTPAPAHGDEIDLLGDVAIGERTPPPQRAMPASVSGARRWLPVGAAAGFVIAAIAGFLIFREGATSVSGGPASVSDANGAKSAAIGSGAERPRDRADARADRGTASKPTDAKPEVVTPPVVVPPQPPSTRTHDGDVAADRPTTPPSGTRGGESADARPGPASQAFTVTVTGAYPFEVIPEEGEASRHAARHELQLTRKQTLRLRAPQYALDRRIPVEAPAGGTVRLQAPALGRLTVRTPFETCEVLANGRSLGYPPIVDQPLASGNYRLVLSCPDGEKHSESVQIAAGQTETALIR